MTIQIGILLFPGFTQLDATGPFEVFSRIPGARVNLVAERLDPVRADTGLRVLPTVTLSSCPQLDVLCVPGGPGQIDAMGNDAVLDWLETQAAEARYVTSVCTGSLLLGAAGLMEGYEATTHWSSMDQLALFGAKPNPARVVRDRNRFSGGGVTAGIDFALTVAAELAGEDIARGIQLGIQYAPEPPFDAGLPDVAPPAVLAAVKGRNDERWIRRQLASEQAASRLRSRRVTEADAIDDRPMLQRVRDEVEELHVFFVDWYAGALERTEAGFADGFLRRFDLGFEMVTPEGSQLDLVDLRDGLWRGHGRNKEFEIEIHDVAVLNENDHEVLATYEEQQSGAKNTPRAENRRRSTVVFRKTRDGLRWKHLLEKWVD